MAVINKAEIIKAHFKKTDKIIYEVIVKMDLESILDPEKIDNYFPRLCKEIINQQLSSKAGDTIFKRFSELFRNKKIDPEQVIIFSAEKIRNVGISRAKIQYIKDLAQLTQNNQIPFEKFSSMKDEEIIIELTKVKGIGNWTAEMFLMFAMGRENVFSHKDLGLKKAIKKLYKFDQDPLVTEVEKIISKWHPYKSYGSLALWSIFD